MRDGINYTINKMPIFFHIQSHAWIALALYLNGYLLLLLFRHFVKPFRESIRSFEAQILGAFFVSISLNFLLALMADLLSLPFDVIGYVYAGLISITSVVVVFLVARLGVKAVLSVELELKRFLLYLVCFAIMFYNGGLIDQISDAWWHLSLSKKISFYSSLSLEHGHLTGSPTRYYPPLWHTNLALLHAVSEESLVRLWNSFSAWGAVNKLMAVYLFANALTRDKNIAFLAAVLFFLLPGIGSSYMRVSAWPSHVSYTAWFVLFSLSFSLYYKLQSCSVGVDSSHGKFRRFKSFLWDSKVYVVLCLWLSLIIYFTHKAEILWFFVAWFAFLAGASLHELLFSISRSSEHTPVRPIELVYFYRVVLIALISLSVWLLFNINQEVNTDQLLAMLFTVVVFLCLITVEATKVVYRRLSLASLAVFVLIVFVSLNYQHIYSLFDRSYSLPLSSTHERPLMVIGWFGGKLALPSWDLQLREGLLYSGLVSFLISTYLYIKQPSFASIFCFSTGFIVLVICCSPYLYYWLSYVLDYHSPWRIALISFHPVVIAIFIGQLTNIRLSAIAND